MNVSIKKELALVVVALLPIAYLAFIWNALPASVPMHWNIEGEIDRFGSKSSLIPMALLIPFLSYLMFIIIPRIDPKNKILSMGNKFEQLKTLMTVFMSVLTLVILYSIKNQSFANPNIIVLMLGMLYILLGNYLQTIKANYFIGIRTPWTLENETVWKETHKMGGKLWFVGGLLVVLFSLICKPKLNSTLFMVVTGAIVLIPVVYSYIRFNALKKAI